MNRRTRHRIKIAGKIVLTLIAVALLVFGSVILKETYDFNRKLAGMKKPLAQMPVDFSRPGKYSVTLPAISSIPHGVMVLVRCNVSEILNSKANGTVLTSAKPSGKLASGKPARKLVSDKSAGKLPSGKLAGKLTPGKSASKLASGKSASKLASGKSAGKLVSDANKAIANDVTLNALTKGINGILNVKKPSGEVVYDSTFKSKDLDSYQDRQQKEWFDIVIVNGYRNYIPAAGVKGSKVTVTVNQGAENLKGIKQTLIVQYWFCGLEMLTVMMGTVIGSVSMLAGLGIGIPITVSWLRKRKKHSDIPNIPNGYSADTGKNSENGKGNVSDIDFV